MTQTHGQVDGKRRLTDAKVTMSERPNTTGSNPNRLSIKDVRAYNTSRLLSTKIFLPFILWQSSRHTLERAFAGILGPARGHKLLVSAQLRHSTAGIIYARLHYPCMNLRGN